MFLFFRFCDKCHQSSVGPPPPPGLGHQDPLQKVGPDQEEEERGHCPQRDRYGNGEKKTPGNGERKTATPTTADGSPTPCGTLPRTTPDGSPTPCGTLPRSSSGPHTTASQGWWEIPPPSC
nr:proline-rich protein 2-like [Crassostrea gigas]